MTRKHFEAIAADIGLSLDTANAQQRSALQALAINLSYTFQGFNANFDPDRFLSACGIGNENASPFQVVGAAIYDADSDTLEPVA